MKKLVTLLAAVIGAILFFAQLNDSRIPSTGGKGTSGAAAASQGVDPADEGAEGPSPATTVTPEPTGGVPAPDSAEGAAFPTAPGSGGAASPVATGQPSVAPDLLAGLEVKGKAPRTGYDRERFGQRWSDDVTVEYGHNGCDTRNDILRRDLDELVVRPGTQGCVAQSGVLDEPYTGTRRIFDRGTDSASRIHIDHVVALANAWETGARFWDDDTRRDFANDPRNLLAVDGAANQRKGAGDAATWQPPNKAFRCAYARRQIDVKAAYGLWVTPAEKAALERELGRCSLRAAHR